MAVVLFCAFMSVSGSASSTQVWTFLEGRVDAVDLLIPQDGDAGPASVLGLDVRGGLEWSLDPHVHWQPIVLDTALLALQTLQQFGTYAALTSVVVRLGDVTTEPKSFSSVEVAGGVLGQVAGGILSVPSVPLQLCGQFGAWLSQESATGSQLSFGFEARLTPRGGTWVLGLRWRPFAWRL